MSKAGRQYDALAGVYDCIWRGYVERTLGALLARIDIDPSSRILDVACGSGVLARKLIEWSDDVTVVGVDASPKMLERARVQAGGARNVRFLHASADALPLESASFDVVLSSNALHYFSEPLSALLEMRRVLRANGRIYLLDWSREFLLMRLRDAVLRLVDPAYVRSYANDEIRRLIEGAGLSLERIDTFRSRTYGLVVVEARRI